MPWGRLDDQANGNAKLLALSDAAWRMWGCGLIYCQANLTDGFIPDHAIHTFGVRERNKEKVAAELCASLVPGRGALWHKVDGGYQVHDYLDWNEARDKVMADRNRARKRLEKHRSQRYETADVNGVGNAFHNAFQTPLCAPVHVPRTTKKQEQEHALSARVSGSEAVKQQKVTDIVRYLRRQRSRETSDGKPAIRVITALARHVIAAYPGCDEAELMERVKQACASNNLAYSCAVGPAIDRARAQLARKKTAGWHGASRSRVTAVAV